VDGHEKNDKPMAVLWVLRELADFQVRLVNDLIKKVNAADAECARLERELAAVTAERDAADAACARLERELAETAAERNAADAECAELERKLTDALTAHAAACSELESMRSQLLQLDVDNANLIAKLRAHAHMITKLRATHEEEA
jgi:chromosome segregation ATPase